MFLSFAEGGLASHIHPLLGGMLTDMTQGIELAWELPTSDTMMSLEGLAEKARYRYAAPNDRLRRRATDGAGEPVLVMAEPA